MAQNYTLKQQNWVNRFSQATVAFMNDADNLTVLCNEFALETYGGGGANQLTDAVVQPVLPASTAALVDAAEGSFAGASQILAVIQANRGYLENMRP